MGQPASWTKSLMSASSERKTPRACAGSTIKWSWFAWRSHMRLLFGLLLGSACNSTDTTPYATPSQLMLVDVAGTWYSAAGAEPRSHLLFAQTRLPAVGGSPQYVDPDWTPTSGCAVNRYDEGAVPFP